MAGGFVYMMSNRRYGTLYVGVTSDLARRAWEHREGVVPGFTRTYALHRLVWYEAHSAIQGAIQREHNMKHWPRRWKTALVDDMNPGWEDLFGQLWGRLEVNPAWLPSIDGSADLN